MLTTKVLALTTSRVVTPKRRLGLYVPAFLNTSAAIGTVEFTGLLIKFTIALGQHLAMPSQRVRTIPALMLNKSSLVIPGFLGTPAGIMTRSIPVRAFSNCGWPKKPRTCKSPTKTTSSTVFSTIIRGNRLLYQYSFLNLLNDSMQKYNNL